jgi:GNAT superfamily N-acetyltransferase
MPPHVALVDAETSAEFCALPGLVPLDAAAVTGARPDASWMLTGPAGTVARCSLWWEHAPALSGHRIGVIGHYAAGSDDAGRQVIAHACAELAAHRCTFAVGPMDGSTFGRYRLVTDQGIEQPFLLEPENPASYPDHFAVSGFAPIARYCSALQTQFGTRRLRLAGIAARLGRHGICIRSLDAARFAEELRRLYPIATGAFTRGFLYSPITEDDFVALYSQLCPYVLPDLVLIAEREDRPVGLLFVLPDWLRARWGGPRDTLILKTLAVLPEFSGSGLPGLLLARGEEIAREHGFTRVIHALIHERNSSLRMSERYGGTIMRRYALFGRPLSPIGRPA